MLTFCADAAAGHPFMQLMSLLLATTCASAGSIGKGAGDDTTIEWYV